MKQNIMKFVSAVLILLMIVSTSACGKNNSEDNSSVASLNTSSSEKNDSYSSDVDSDIPSEENTGTEPESNTSLITSTVTSSNNKGENSSVNSTNSDNNNKTDTGLTYDLDTFTQDMFTGTKVYYDSVCFAEDKNGNVNCGALLYEPSKIIGVYSTDLQTQYYEDKDFTVKGKYLVRTANSSIPVFKFKQYAQSFQNNAATSWLRIVGSDYECKLTTDMMKCQLFVTYEHKDSWTGAAAASQLSHLTKTAQKLKNRQKLNFVFFGDSITCGCDASGQNENVVQHDNNNAEIVLKNNRAPYMPSWAEMTVQKLKKFYNNSNIVKINRGSGGSHTTWGKTAADAMINDKNPDLVLIAFGMNQTGFTGDQFKADIKEIINTVHKKNPNAEFLLVSCMIPNVETVTFKKHKLAEQEAALYQVQSEMSNIGIGVVPIYSIFKSMTDGGKRFIDYTSNNANHPNDFGCRVYAQAILKSLGV